MTHTHICKIRTKREGPRLRASLQDQEQTYQVMTALKSCQFKNTTV